MFYKYRKLISKLDRFGVVPKVVTSRGNTAGSTENNK